MAKAPKTTSAATAPAAAKVVAKRSTTKKSPHPLRGKFGADKKPIATANWPFETLPTDYSHKTMSPLTKKDFKSESGFFDYLGSVYEAKASAFRTKAEESRTMGTGEDRKNAKRLAAIAAQTELLVAKMSKGIGAAAVAKIIANAKAKVEAEAAAAGGATKTA